MARRKGYKVPKGASLTDKGYRPSFLTEEEAKAFQKEKNLYNRRVQARTRKIRKMLPDPEGVTDLEIRRTGMTGVKWKGTVKDIKSREEYEHAMDLFATDKDQPAKYSKRGTARKGSGSGKPKTMKEKREKNLRETTFDVITEGFDLTEEEAADLREKLDSMSIEDIINWRFENPDIVDDYFERYQYAEGRGNTEPKDREKAKKRLWDSLNGEKDEETEEPPEESAESLMERLRKLISEGGEKAAEAKAILKEMEAAERKARRFLRMR